MPSPHLGSLQPLVQPSSSTVLPSSHSSVPCLLPSPQRGVDELEELEELDELEKLEEEELLEVLWHVHSP